MYLQRRDKEQNLYKQLQDQSLEMLQRLSGNLWTDFNEHDPGVTLMDACNYALFESNYRMEFAFEEYLANPADGKLNYAGMGLLPGHIVFAPTMVTPGDYEHLIKAHVPGVKECTVSLSGRGGNYYTIEVQVKEGCNPEAVREVVEKVYHRHRNLCENLKRVVIVERIRQKGSKYYFEGRDIVYAQDAEETTVTRRNPYEYHSIQYELPDCYGINDRGLPSDASEERKAVALQLKAYLLMFDYMLAGIGRQTQNIHQLLELSDRIPSRFTLEMNVDELDLLLDKEQAERTEIFCPEELHKQKSSYLDFLDGMYGENTRLYFDDEGLSLPEINKERAALMRRLPEVNTRRFGSFDVTDEGMKTKTGLKEFVSAVLGMDPDREISLLRACKPYNLTPLEDAVYYQSRKKVLGGRYHAESMKDKHRFSAVPRQAVDCDDGRMYAILKKRLHIFADNTLPATMPSRGGFPENYKCREYTLHNGASRGYTLLYRPTEKREWIGIGHFSSREALIETANRLWVFMDRLRYESVPFYVVEHTLLLCKKAKGESNTLSMIVPRVSWGFVRGEDARFRAIIEERLPVHVSPAWHVLNPDDYYRFECLYFQWRAAWAAEYADEEKKEVRRLSEQIRNML